MAATATSDSSPQRVAGKAWSFGAQISRFECIRDADGRPVLENRAPAIVKQGVPMVMRRCPYDDERKGRWMNVSALAQITSHLDDSLEDIAAFHAALPGSELSWERFAMALFDQLAQCALCLLRSNVETLQLPAALSVGYKVSAGYLVPIRELLQLSIQGKAPPASTENLKAHVHRRTSLVGAREVCAAPLIMVDRVSGVFLGGLPSVTRKASRERVVAARGLTQQLLIGLLWQQYDRGVEQRLLGSDIPAEAVRGQTQHVRRELSARISEVADNGEVETTLLPEIFDVSQRASIRWALRPSSDDVRDKWADTERALEDFVRERCGAIVLEDASLAPLIAQRFAAYLRTYREFVALFDEIEVGLRRDLNFPDEAPILRDSSLFPSPRSLPWLEMLSGHRLRYTDDSQWVLRSLKRTFALPA